MNIKETAIGLFFIWTLGLMIFLVAFLVLIVIDVNEAIRISRYFPSLGLISAVILLGTFYYVVQNVIEQVRRKVK